jgi:hypothetical protein
MQVELGYQSKSEVDRISGMLRAKSEEAEQLRLKVTRLEMSSADTKMQQDKLYVLQSDLEQWKSRYARLEAQNEDLRTTCERLERKVSEQK